MASTSWCGKHPEVSPYAGGFCPKCESNFIARLQTHCSDPSSDALMGKAADDIESLRQQLSECQRERDHWKANHDSRVEAARVLIERDDLPRERINAYEKYVECQKDAVRYRWFREVIPNVIFDSLKKEIFLRKSLSLRDWDWNGEQLDAAIDKAMKEEV